MATVVTRLFADKAKADEVVMDLRGEGFGPLDYDVIAADDRSGADIEDAMARASVFASARTAYATRVASGGALVVVRAPFGTTILAANTMDRNGPLDAGVKRQEVYAQDRLHTKMALTGMRFLSGPIMPAIIGVRRPFESMFFMPSIISSGRGAKLLTGYTTPLSSMLFLPLLSGKGSKTKLVTKRTTPFSSMFALPLLWRHRSTTSVS